MLFGQATLWSKIFKQEIELGHSEEAYNAMLANPDSTRSDTDTVLHTCLISL